MSNIYINTVSILLAAIVVGIFGYFAFELLDFFAPYFSFASKVFAVFLLILCAGMILCLACVRKTPENVSKKYYKPVSFHEEETQQIKLKR